MIWGTDVARTESIQKYRRRLFKQSIAALRALDGWGIESVQSSKGTWAWKVSRPKSRFAAARRMV